MKKLLLFALAIGAFTFSNAQYTLEPSDVKFENGIIEDYLNLTQKNIIIPDNFNGITVTEIGRSAFSQNDLTNVTIPSTVEIIGNQAFNGNKLTTITIPDAVTTIGTGAFSGSPTGNQLTSVTIGGSVTSIGSFAFTTNRITSIIIPNSVNSIGFSAFSDNQIRSLTLGNNVTTIENRAFYGNELTNLLLPNSVTNIGDWAFNLNQLSNITFSENLSSIGYYAFSGNNLNNITLPNAITFIGEQAFGFNNFSMFNLPNQHQGYIYTWNNGTYKSGDNVSTAGEYQIFEREEILGIVENSFGDELLVYPNPTNGNFSINLRSIYESSVVLITDVSGKLIHSKTISRSQVLNLSIKEPAGIYLISIQSGDKKAVVRLIKE